MARMIARYCLWTILLTFQLTHFRATAAETNATILPDQWHSFSKGLDSESSKQRFASILEPKCELFSQLDSLEFVGKETEWETECLDKPLIFRDIVGNDLPPRPRLRVVSSLRVTEIQNTCPFEHARASISQPIAASSCEETGLHASKIWNGTWVRQFLEPDYLNLAQHWAQDEFIGFEARILESAKTAGKLAMSKFTPLIRRSTTKNVPITRVSHLTSEPESLDPESIFEDEPDTQRGGTLLSLPIQEGETADSYWQYYEDCDRWGVNFANLLIQANSAALVCDSAAKIPDSANLRHDEPAAFAPISAISLFATPGILRFSSNLPANVREAIHRLRDWVSVCEFRYIELERANLDHLDLGLNARFSLRLISLCHQARALNGDENLIKTLACPPFFKVPVAFDELAKTAKHLGFQGFELVNQNFQSAPAFAIEQLGIQLDSPIRWLISHSNTMTAASFWFSANRDASLASVPNEQQN